MFPLLLHLTSRVRNLLYLIIVPQLQWNLICLKWVEILEHNIRRKWLKQRLFNIHSGELRRKTNSFWKLDKFCALSLQLLTKANNQLLQVLPCWQKYIYRRPQNFCKNAQELLTKFYLAGVKLLKRKKKNNKIILGVFIFIILIFDEFHHLI